MANTVDKVIAVALAEEGYLEKSASAVKRDPTVLDRKTDGAGNDNYTKYGRDMHKAYPAVMDYPAYWCDAFVDWCFYKAYGTATAKSLLAGNFDDYTVASCQKYRDKGALDFTPTVGVQVFFTKNGAVNGCYHTGLVYKVDGTYFYTIEGNTSQASAVVPNCGGVARKKYGIAEYKGRTLFGHPKYDAASSSPGSGKKLNSTEQWKGKVTSPELNIRTWAGTEYPACSFSPLAEGAAVSVCDSIKAENGSDWYYIKSEGKYGFASAKYIERA